MKMSNNFLYRSFYFEPKELTKLSEKIEKKYRNVDSEIIGEIAAKKLSSLLAAIRKLANDPEKIIQYADSLKKIDVRILAYEFPYHQEDQETQKKIFLILEHRYERFIGRRMWDHFHVYPKDYYIYRLLNVSFKNEDESFLSLQSRIRKHYNMLFAQQNPLALLAKWIGAETKKLAEAFKEWRIYPETNLEKILWTYILFVYISESNFIKKEGEEEIVYQLNQLNIYDYKKILQKYLQAFDYESFHYTILKQAVDKLGDPRKQVVSWEGFSNDEIDKVKRWLMHNELKKFFAEDTEYQRFKYWGRYVKVMKDAKPIKSPPIAIMDFGYFVVVEFAQTNNAAYFYTKENYERYIAPRIHKRRLKEDDLKEKGIMITKLSHNRTRANPHAWHKKFDEHMIQYMNGNLTYGRGW
jgi:hypothetical protein